MMEVTLNGKRYTTRAGITVHALLDQLAMGPEYIAVEVNNQIVKRKDWGHTTLHPDDKIEVVRFVGGGLGAQPYDR